MDPLSITASVTAILTAAAQVCGILTQIRNASASVAAILTEVEHIDIVFRALQRFIDHARRAARQRAALIQIGDITLILTRTVLAFSELQTLVEPLSADYQKSSIRLRYQWWRQEPGVSRLVDQLQRHKSSLSLLLQVIQCDSDLRARKLAQNLRQQIEDEVEEDAGLVERFEELELPPDAVSLQAPSETHNEGKEATDLDIESTTPVRAITSQPQEIPHLDFPEANPGMQATYNVVLATTRVYSRVKDRDVDAITTVSTTRSHPWSILSDISMTNISVIAVISLPLYESELRRFRRLISPVNHTGEDLGFDNISDDGFARSTQFSHLTEEFLDHYGIHERKWANQYPESLENIKSQLENLRSDPFSMYSAGPVGENLNNWHGWIRGPNNTPYSRGLFFLAIRFSGNHPIFPPRITFRTRMFHPNISADGIIQLGILGTNWNPTLTINEVLQSIVTLLYSPNVDEPLIPEIAKIYKTDRERYYATAREWTMRYAM